MSGMFSAIVKIMLRKMTPFAFLLCLDNKHNNQHNFLFFGHVLVCHTTITFVSMLHKPENKIKGVCQQIFCFLLIL